MPDKLRVAVILEWHPFDVPHFYEMLRSFDDVEFFVQPWDIFVADPARQSYDALLFYNMSFPLPPEDDSRRRYVEDELGTSGQGIVLLHHGILSYEAWPVWDAVSGVPGRSFTYHQGETVHCKIVDEADPITAGMDDFTIVDETYLMDGPTPDNHVLVTTDNQLSVPVLAWTRQYKNARVFCYASGHDNQTWSSPDFRQLLHSGLLWAAHRN